jgi:hypothetical protein
VDPYVLDNIFPWYQEGLAEEVKPYHRPVWRGVFRSGN